VIDLTSALAALTPEEKEDECIAHAIALRSAWSHGNYRRFFRLYVDAPKMSGYLMDWFIDRERRRSLTVIIKAYVASGLEMPMRILSILLSLMLLFYDGFIMDRYSKFTFLSMHSNASVNVKCSIRTIILFSSRDRVSAPLTSPASPQCAEQC
jgi:hypothetical protein